jgi:multidrug efflux pump subunit AcrB
VPGLATPAPYGGKTRQVIVDVDPSAAAARGLSPDGIVQTLLQSNLTVPAGTARIGDTEYDVTINNSPSSIEEFNRIPVKADGGATVVLGDVAKVHDGFSVQQNIVRVNGHRATYLAILRKSHASTLAVVDATKELLPKIRANAPPGIELDLAFDQSSFVRAAIRSVALETVLASALVALMILVFLGSARSVVVVTVSIPLAICAALAGLFLTGQSLNVMTLGGLALAVGMLVDDATVEVENIHRHLQAGYPVTTAILRGAREIALPALAATTTVCIVFLPVALLEGPARSLFVPLALSVVFAMTASYLLSRTLVPVVARRLFADEHARERARDGSSMRERIEVRREGALRAVERAYARVLSAVMGHRAIAMTAAAVVLVGTCALSRFVGLDFFPEVDAGQMRLHVRAPTGTRIERTEQLVADVERRIREIIPSSDLDTITDNIGVPTPYNLAFVQSDNLGGQDADVLVALRRGHAPTERYRTRLRKDLAQRFPGSQFYFQSADVVSQVLNFGISAPIDVQIEAKDLNQSAALARALRRKLALVPGIVDVRTPQVFDAPALEVDVDRERAAEIGLSQQRVASSVLTTLSSSSLVAPSFWLSPKNNVNYLVAVRTPTARLASTDDLMATPLAADGTPNQTSPYLGSIATLRPAQTKALVTHETVQRVVDVQCGVEGRDLGSVAKEIDRAVSELGAPNARIQVRGQIESMYSELRSLGSGLVLATVLVYFILVVLLQSWRDPLIIMAAVPGALVGVCWMLGLTGTSLNVESLMGIIMAVGVGVSNSILVVVFANNLRVERRMDRLSAVITAARTRLRPVLMTALAMTAGMVPMALGRGEGAEQNAPLGRAVIGGLVAAVLVTLFLIPVLYSLFARSDREESRVMVPS